MEGRPERIVDYFVVVGLGSNVNPFKVELVDEDCEGSLKLAPPININPITEIGLVSKKTVDTIPKGFKCIETTEGGHSASLSNQGLFGSSLFLCYRQGRDKPPITEISIYNAENGRQFPDGHETIAVTMDGRSGDLSGGGKFPMYLTVKRGFTHGYNSSTAVTKLAVIADGKEEPPAGYRSLSFALGRGLMSSGARICYKTNIISPQSLAYTAEIISRYPTADQTEFPLPESVPLFCLPFGVSVEPWNRRTPFPLPTFSTFALTSALGICMYGACVVFYEQVPDIPALKDMRRKLSVGNETALYMSKCICLLSHWPFFAAFRDFLSSLYRLSLSQDSSIPLERYIANLFTDVPFPTPRRPRVQLQIGPESIVFSLPIRTPLPMGVTTHWTLLSCLDVEHCITLLHLALLEQKIVLHSYRPALLTSIGEAIRSILFPLQWQCTYIPMCPLAFASYLQAPVPFIIGMDSRYFESFSAPPEVCVLDLDADTLIMGSYAKQHITLNPLPQKPVRLLRKNLMALANEVSSLSFNGDFAVEVAPINLEESIKLQQERIDITVREVFLRFISSLLSNYSSFLCPLMSKPSFRYQDVSDLFNIESFLKQKQSSERPFYKTFLDTQTFTSFIEQRSFAHSESSALSFFDDCTAKILSDPNAKLLNIEEILSKRYDLPTVVTPPPDESGLIQGRKYSYKSFPRLDPTLFHSPLKRVSKSAASAQKDHAESSQSALINMAVRTQAEKTKSKTFVERASGSDALWSKILLSHACSTWYMLLSHHLRSQWNKLEVLSQALELLEVMRNKQALPSDEVCYRALMEQCVQLGKPALAVRVYSAIQRAGIHPSAVTYGFYNKALVDKEWPSVKRRWKVLKIVFYACFYLRYLQRQAQITGRKGSIISMEEREANFQFIRRSSSQQNELSLTALDIGVEEVQGPSLMNVDESRGGSQSKISRGSVYRLNRGSSNQMTDDYAFRGDSFYIADKSPLLREAGRSSGGLGFLKPVKSVSSSSMEVVSEREVEGAKLEVCICSSIQCPNCKSLLYDEEIMAAWSDDVDEYNIACPYCYKSLVPSLTVRIKKLLPSESKTTPNIPIIVSSVDQTIPEESSNPSISSSSSSRDPSLTSRDPSLTSLDPSPEEKNPPISIDSDDIDGILKNKPLLPSTDPTHRKTRSMGRVSTDTSPLALETKHVSDRRTKPIRSKTISSEAEEEEDTRSKTLPRQSQSQVTEQTDSRDMRHYIAMLKQRGHKRTSSAPVPSSPRTNPRTNRVCLNTDESDTSEGEKPSVLSNTSSNTKHLSYEVVDQDPLIVPYLNPIVLRKELESLLTQGKSFILSSESFTVDKPILYWNLVWYFTRLKLPTYLPLLLLRKVVKDHPQLKKPGVRMQVETAWDSKFPGVSDPLYMIWVRGSTESIVPQPSIGSRKTSRRNSAMQLQPLVARMQCGDLQFILRSILDDRREQDGVVENTGGIMETSLTTPLLQRSAYRQLLFLKLSLNPDTFDIDLFDKEYQLCLQRLPKESAILLQSWDYPPSAKACHCRKEFGLLQLLL